MKYTDKQRREIYDALVGAKTRLSSPDHYGGTSYICHAIEDYLNIKGDDKCLATEMIRDRLKPCISFDGWLEIVCKIPDEQLTWQAVQKHRHAWLDLLIKEFEAK